MRGPRARQYRIGARTDGEKKLILSNFHPNTTEEELLELFDEYGIESVVLKPGKYAVLTFEDDCGAAVAKEAWGGAVLYGYWFRIKYADW